ncbi:Thermoresistant gluconokinase family protein [Aspergillus sp. HF37]|nr:Thermoresistant gluconokinase family protein [Aspergillus sp. HF37]
MLSAGERPQPTINGAAKDPSVVQAASASASASPESASMWQTTRSAQVPIQHIWVITGPAGSGKSTVGRGLQEELNLPFLEGDDFHPSANKQKMLNGTPLNDEDRWDWLISLRKAAIEILTPSELDRTSTRAPNGVIVACSALKQKYRDVMRVAAYGSPFVQIHFIYLRLGENVLVERVRQRDAHYMKSGMIHSQLQVLEEPQGEWDALTVNVEGSPEDVQERVSKLVAGKLAEYL